MTSDDARYPAYHPRSTGLSGPGIGLVAVVAGLSYLAAAGAGALARAGGVVLLALLAGGYLRSRGSATITGPAGITVRRPPTDRTLAWADIQAIDIESHAVWTVQAREMRKAVVIYDAQGRRVPLPNVDSRQVPALDEERQRLCALWEQERGPDWPPTDEQ